MKWALLLVAGASAAGLPNFAGASCTPPSRLSTCIDADTFWPHADPGRFFFLSGPSTTPAERMEFGLATTYLVRPIVLVVPSAGASIELPAVDKLIDTTFLWSLGVSDHAAIEIALPVTTYRSGEGVSPLISQHAKALSETSLRDIRVGAAYRLLSPPGGGGTDGLTIASRFELGLPTGDEQSFAGDRSFVGLPSSAFELRTGPWLAGAALGARLRETADLAGGRIGSQVVVGLGVGASALSEDRLTVAVEAMALPTLAAQASSVALSPTGARTEIGATRPLVPAEWAFSVASTPWPSSHLSIGAAAGGSLPFTGEAPLTSPRFRVSLVLRYAPSPAEIRTPAR